MKTPPIVQEPEVIVFEQGFEMSKISPGLGERAS
jgi:hypothetical protein